MTDAPVLVTIADGIAEIRLNRPKQLNVLDLAMGEALAEATARVAADEAVRVVILSGAGRSFMAGGDLVLFHQDLAGAPATAGRLIELFHAAMRAIRGMGKPVIAALQGPVAGGGLGLALACDLAVASEDATFLSAYTRIGTSPDGGTTWSLTRLLGPRRAMEVMLLNDRLDAKTALSLGLVNRVVPSDTLGSETRALAQRLAKASVSAGAAVKRLVASAITGTFEDQLDREKASFMRQAGTPDFHEGINAFFERREPTF
jgi:2-(1,2-epoxy-1,2-dihydrophenyl)acetyl-CoA isomerase